MGCALHRLISTYCHCVVKETNLEIFTICVAMDLVLVHHKEDFSGCIYIFNNM